MSHSPWSLSECECQMNDYLIGGVKVRNNISLQVKVGGEGLSRLTQRMGFKTDLTDL